MPDRKRVYLAGPMTGMKFHNAPAFAAFKEELESIGYSVVTPVELNSRVWQRKYGVPFDPYTMTCDYGHELLPEMFAEDVVEILTRVDAVAVMPGWDKSEGVARELAVATLFNKEIFDALSRRQLDLRCHIMFALRSGKIPASATCGPSKLI